MRIALIMVSALTLSGCSLEDVQPPTSVPDPETSPATLWGLVVDTSGVCIADATATVVGGQNLGQTRRQTTPCDAWAYSGGFVFEDLAPGVEMTIRVSAPGYGVEERTVTPGSGPQMAVLFTPPQFP